MKESEPPPPYSSLPEHHELIPPSEHDPPAYDEQYPLPKPITSGPVLYPGDTLLELIVWLYMLGGFVIKMVMSFGFHSESCSIKGCAQVSVNRCHFCFFIFALNFINAFNVWPYFCMVRDLEMEQRLRSPGTGIIFGFFDCVISTLVVLASLAAAGEYKYTYQFLTFPGLFLVIAGIGVMYIVSKYTMKLYTPYDPKNELVLARRREIHFTAGVRLTIRESGSFRIILENIGNTTVDGSMKVERNVVTSSYTRRGIKKYRNNLLDFYVQLPKPIEPGDVVTLIPGSHREDGTYRVNGFRAFGADKGDIIYTSFCNEEGRCLVRLTEEFKKDKFMANQIALQTMDDRMKRQIYGATGPTDF